MMQSIYTAKIGILAQQKRTDTIANNIANINTNGFKSSSVSFKDALYSIIKRPVESNDNLNLRQGNGVMISEITRSFAKGAPTETGVPLDMRIEGDGFFTVSDANGELNYTRNGSFAASKEGNSLYLVNRQGCYILDTDSNRIDLPDNIKNISVKSNGEIYVNDSIIATLNIVKFTNNNGLEATKNGCYAETLASGEPKTNQSSLVYQGSLEGSNVDMALEMTRLIRAQRAFSLVSKALKTADDMSAIANNMRG